MQYVFDSNILIDIYQNYYPEVFESVWEKIEELISNEIMVSIVEVREELKSKNIRDQWLKINNNCNGLLFRELVSGEEECIPLIEDLPIYREEFHKKKIITTLEKEWGDYATVIADPWLIAYGWKHNVTVVTNESPKKKYNIPHVCDELNVNHINLKEFFKENNIKF